LDVIRDVTGRLERAGIGYMLTGSMAMNYYAEPRMTRDIDLVVALSVDSVSAVAALFQPDYYISIEAAMEAVRSESIFNMIHEESIIKVDVIVRKTTPFRLSEFQRRQRIHVQDVDLWIVSREDLILSKLVWAKPSHSELQLRDVRNLIAAEYDHDYVSKWAETLGISELFREINS
jgi:hypothetical protein